MNCPSRPFRTMEEFRAWCEAAPPGTRVAVRALVKIFEDFEELAVELREPDPGDPQGIEQAWTWRERLWVAPADTRLNASEVAEALGRPRSWVYERTSRSRGRESDRLSGGPQESIPHRKIGGSLVFVAGEVREWLERQEERVVGG